MYNFSFKGDTLYRLITSGGIDLFIPRIVLWGDTISLDIGKRDSPCENAFLRLIPVNAKRGSKIPVNRTAQEVSIFTRMHCGGSEDS